MSRNAYFDNAKVILIFLVVFGHMIQPFIQDSVAVHTFYMWVYTFHMPAFIFISGYFAKGSGNLKYIGRLAQRLLIPYMIFQITYTLFYIYVGKMNVETDLFYPRWSLWFLLSLFCWHLLLIIYRRFSPIFSLLIALQIGIIVGYFSEVGHMYSLSRTFVFFPFFLAGYFVQEKHLIYIKNKFTKIAALIVMGIVAVAIYLAPDFNSGWLLASKPYEVLGLPKHGGFARLFVYITSFFMAASILTWIPQRRFSWTRIGERTLYIYLLHGFFIQYFRIEGLFHIKTIVDFISLAVLSALIVYILASRPVIMLSQPFIENRMMVLRRFIKRIN